MTTASLHLRQCHRASSRGNRRHTGAGASAAARSATRGHRRSGRPRPLLRLRRGQWYLLASLSGHSEFPSSWQLVSALCSAAVTDTQCDCSQCSAEGSTAEVEDLYGHIDQFQLCDRARRGSIWLLRR